MNDKKRTTILVTGANGQLAGEIKLLSENYPDHRFLFADKASLPIDNADLLKNFFDYQFVDICVNCAAYTAVDLAEKDADRAFAVNAYAVESLARICKNKNAKLIHISTDYVYDGSKKEPLKETDAVAPINVYGKSKLKGEELAFAENPETLVIRTSWVYGLFGKNFVKTMMRLLIEKEELNVVADQIGCPTYTKDLAQVILIFIDKIAAGENFSGIYNYSNYGITSWFQFAQYIKEVIGSNCKLNPVSSEQYITPALRPLYSVLDTTKIQETLKIEIPFWKVSVAHCIERIIEGRQQ